MQVRGCTGPLCRKSKVRACLVCVPTDFVPSYNVAVKIFVSHNAKDKDTARLLANASQTSRLSQTGFVVGFLLDRYEWWTVVDPEA